MEKKAVVYHVRLKDHNLEEGYIGITTDFKSRKSQHKHRAFKQKSEYRVYCAMRKYWDELIWDIIFEGTYEECRVKEKELRPRVLMGWNTVEGGQEAHKTQLGKKRPEHSKWAKINGFKKGNTFNHKAVYCNGFIFCNMEIAAKALNINRKTIYNRIKNNKFENFSYLEEV